jgi:hypothetical protein
MSSDDLDRRHGDVDRRTALARAHVWTHLVHILDAAARLEHQARKDGNTQVLVEAIAIKRDATAVQNALHKPGR